MAGNVMPDPSSTLPGHSSPLALSERSFLSAHSVYFALSVLSLTWLLTCVTSAVDPLTPTQRLGCSATGRARAGLGALRPDARGADIIADARHMVPRQPLLGAHLAALRLRRLVRGRHRRRDVGVHDHARLAAGLHARRLCGRDGSCGTVGLTDARRRSSTAPPASGPISSSSAASSPLPSSVWPCRSAPTSSCNVRRCTR